MSEKLIWKSEGGEIEVLPLRARALQVRVAGHEAFWTNPAWDGDWNAGGDRLWLAPEVDWNWKTNKGIDLKQYEIPAQSDPGTWKMKEQGEGFCHVEQDVSLSSHHRDSGVEVRVGRRMEMVSLEDAPLWSTPGGNAPVAFSTESTLQINGGTPGQRVDLWSVLQLPVGGAMHIACRKDAKFRDYFAPITPDLWGLENGAYQFHITGTQQYKLGLSPRAVSGRMAYARDLGEEFLVVYRQFLPQAWRPYADAPMDDPHNDAQSRGDAIQIYNDDGSFGGFGEMEFHSPALVVGEGAQNLSDVNLCVVGFVAKTDWAAWREYWLLGA